MNVRIRSFATREQAEIRAQQKTRAHAKGDREIFVVIEGPASDWVVADLRTAVEIGLPYSWAV